MNAATLLPVAWLLVIGFAVLMYVLLDGFVLGLGILLPFGHDEHERDRMMNTAAPIWDGNETWLVLGGSGLLAAFPKVYGAMLSGLYLPVLLMLIALVFRGVAFEFRFKANRTRPLWGAAFFLGSLVATFAQGVILGAIVQGIPLAEGERTAGAFAWFSPFVVLTGLSLIAGYALLGATWLVLKTDGALQDLAYALTRPLVIAVIAAMLLVSAWLPFLDAIRMQRWFNWPSVLWLSPVPVLTALNAVLLWRAVARRHERAPFVLTVSFFGLGFLGLVLGMWPYLLPPRLTIWNSAATPSSQTFVLIGALVLIPLVLAYTAYSYRVFRGKLAGDAGYHD